MEGVSQLVDSLDARFEIVTLGQILELIKDNVPHQHAQPDIYAPCPDVPD
ncbi:MAG: hypothetical protein MJ233_03460 [Mycoplasmoidaceae bacterium]|nr:hypothetical protein [Mycoplasmoidaceae bacterium]